jgi:hypothetical protein
MEEWDRIRGDIMREYLGTGGFWNAMLDSDSGRCYGGRSHARGLGGLAMIHTAQDIHTS